MQKGEHSSMLAASLVTSAHTFPNQLTYSTVPTSYRPPIVTKNSGLDNFHAKLNSCLDYSKSKKIVVDQIEFCCFPVPDLQSRKSASNASFPPPPTSSAHASPFTQQSLIADQSHDAMKMEIIS